MNNYVIYADYIAFTTGASGFSAEPEVFGLVMKQKKAIRERAAKNMQTKTL
jgi:hypothetical protein